MDNLEDIRLSEISQSQKDKCCVIPFIRHTWSSQNHKDRKYNGGFQGLRRGDNRESLFIGYRVSVLHDKRSYGDGW